MYITHIYITYIYKVIIACVSLKIGDAHTSNKYKI